MPTLTLLILLFIIPVVGAVLALAVRDRASGPLSTLVAGAVAALSLLAIHQTYASFPGGVEQVLASVPWLGQMAGGRTIIVGFFGVKIDPLAALMLAVTTVAGFIVILYSTQYLTKKNRETPTESGQARYYFWLLIFLASMVGLALSPNLLQMFIFWELTTLCSWALISFRQDEKALRAGYKSLILTHLGGLVFMVALVVMFAQVKSFDFSALRALRPGMQSTVFILLFVAAMAKSAQLPFYNWLPDAMEAPTPVSAYLHAAAMVKAGAYLMARVAVSNPAVPHAGPIVMLVVSIVTINISVFLYLFQDDLKRLLAYSTIAHLSLIYMMIGFGLLVGSTLGFQAACLHIACHGTAKALIFLTVGSIAYATGTKRISELGGLARKMPLTAASFVVGAFAVTGPALAGFWSKYFMLVASLGAGGPVGILVGVIIIITAVIAAGWFTYTAQRVFLGRPTALKADFSDPPPAMAAALIILIALAVVVAEIVLPLVDKITL